MNDLADSWYIRYPDGRVLRATSTATVRQQLGAGRMPSGTLVRRSADAPWQALERVREFADLAPAPAPDEAEPSAPRPPSARQKGEPFPLVGADAPRHGLF